jgi:hypothetical protein
MAACSFQFIKTILDPFHGDRLKARPHYAQAVADAGPDLTVESPIRHRTDRLR